jgi:hypothetical protein
VAIGGLARREGPGTGEPFVQLRATRRSDVLNISIPILAGARWCTGSGVLEDSRQDASDYEL